MHKNNYVKRWIQLRLLYCMSAIVFPPNNLHFQSREILGSSTSNQNNMMFLKGMLLFRYIRRYFFTIAQSHSATLSLRRIRLLRFADDGLQHKPFHLRSSFQGALSWWLPFHGSVSYDLIQGALRDGTAVDVTFMG